jgi:hypothetical protein
VAAFIVKEGQRVTVGDGKGGTRTYSGGDTVELQPELAATMPWAVDAAPAPAPDAKAKGKGK